MVTRRKKQRSARLILGIAAWIVLLVLVSGRAWGQGPTGEEGEKLMEYQSLTPDLLVENVDATVAWWHDMFGFEAVQTAPENPPFDFAMVQAGGATVMFQKRNGLADEYERFRNAKPGDGFTLFVRMKGVRALREKIGARANVLKELETTFYGALEFAVVDPNGIVVVIAEFEDE